MKALTGILLMLAIVFSAFGQHRVLAEERPEESISGGMMEERAFEYLLVEKPYLTTPDTQRIVLSLKDGMTAESAVLFYKNQETGETGEIAASRIEGEAALFEKEYADEKESGVYSLTGAKIISQGKETEFSLKEEDVQGKYGVNRQVETKPDAYIEQDGEIQTAEKAEKSSEQPLETGMTELSLTMQDANGEMISDSVAGKSVEEVSAKIATSLPAPAPPENLGKTTVIVLDPGHGGGDPGAAYFGETEKDLALKIARYCKAALERNQGVKVYLTRDSDRWVGEGVTRARDDLEPRIAFAKSVNADIFVSLHLNATGTGAGKGAEIYYPAAYYNSDAGTVGKELAQSIQKELVALGLYNRGVKAGDIYYVIREGAQAGIPSILIEHAFLDNEGDYEKFLNSDDKLKKLGEADAKGIASCLNLVGGKNGGEWIQDSNGWWYKYRDGSYPVNQWLQINGIWYYFNGRGYCHTGWLTYGNKTFYLQSSGAMQTGWLNLGKAWYYFSEEGEMATGWTEVLGFWYYFRTAKDSSGNKGQMCTGLITERGNKYYLNPTKNQYGSEGIMRTGWVLEGGKWYFFNTGIVAEKSVGAAATGWLLQDQIWYYLNSDGTMKTGWLEVSGSWYYLLSTGQMVTGTRTIDGKTHGFDALGRWTGEKEAVRSGWVFSGDKWYYYSDQGVLQTGWLYEGGRWYYLMPTGSRGAMCTGWLNLGKEWYYLNPQTDQAGPKGAMCTGIITERGNKYYLNPKADQRGSQGAMITGWVQEEGKWYFFNTGITAEKPAGAAVTGWLLQDQIWYYLNSDGTMKTGWLEAGGKKYYLLPTGQMVTGTRNIDGKVHVFNDLGQWIKEEKQEDGQTKTGWKKQGDDWYYYNMQGVLQTGWLYEGNAWYYMNPEDNTYGKKGLMRTGWVLEGNDWYFMNQQSDGYGPIGSMRTGWVQIAGNKYYMNPQTDLNGQAGSMRTGWVKIGELWHYFNKGKEPEGLLTFSGHTIMGQTGVTVDQMVRMYQKSGKSYPSEALALGNAGTIQEFCQIVYEEAKAEGVKAEVVFAQAMKETGYLQFGGDVKIQQFNFAGLGATGNGVPGEQFADVRTGIRAQVQHLKAYASVEPLKNAVVDGRFQYVSPRGSAPCVEALGIQDNPAGRLGWAMAKGYGFSLYSSYIEPIYGL